MSFDKDGSVFRHSKNPPIDHEIGGKVAFPCIVLGDFVGGKSPILVSRIKKYLLLTVVVVKSNMCENLLPATAQFWLSNQRQVCLHFIWSSTWACLCLLGLALFRSIFEA